MRFVSLWDRYFYWEILKNFCLFLVAFYLVYAVVDYSSKAKAFADSGMPVPKILLFYLCLFVRRIELIAPFGFMIASMRLLLQLNLRNELVAMLAGGISMRRLLRPFIVVSLFLITLTFINLEYWLPVSQRVYRKLEDAYLKHGGRRKQLMQRALYDIRLPDDSLMLYQHYDSAKERFFDVFWVRDADDLYRIKYLDFKDRKPVGRLVDHLVRDVDHRLQLAESVSSRPFSEIFIDEELISLVLNGPREQSYTRLYRQMPDHFTQMNDREAAALTYFQYKLMIPWLCLLVILGPAPLCVRFTRRLRPFLIYGAAILSLISFYLVMDAAVILGEHQVIHPLLAVWLPAALFFGVAGYRFYRLA